MAEAYDGKLWLLGGYNAKNIDTGGRANLRDIWYSENGSDWHIYNSRNPWNIRHASYHAQKDGKVWLIGGFDNYEANGFYRDVWTFDNRNLYLKVGQDPNQLRSWTYTMDTTGPNPGGFADSSINFYFRGDSIHSLHLFEPPGANHVAIIGTGKDSSRVIVTPSSLPSLPLFISQGSTLVLSDTFYLEKITMAKGSRLHIRSQFLSRLPDITLHSLKIENVVIDTASAMHTEFDLEFNGVTWNIAPDGIIATFGRALTLNEIPQQIHYFFEGTSPADQHIKVLNPLRMDRLKLKKKGGEFLLDGHLEIMQELNVERNHQQ